MKLNPIHQKAVDRKDEILSRIDAKGIIYLDGQWSKKSDLYENEIKETLKKMYGLRKKSILPKVFIVLDIIFFLLFKLHSLFFDSPVLFYLSLGLSVGCFIAIFVSYFILYYNISKVSEYLQSMFTIKMTGGSIDEYFDEEAINANVDKMSIFNIENDELLSIDDTTEKEISGIDKTNNTPEQNDNQKSKAKGVLAGSEQKEFVGKRITELERKFKHTQKKIDTIEIVKITAIVFLVIGALLLLLPLFKSGGEKWQNFYEMAIFDFKTHFSEDGGLWFINVLVYGRKTAWQVKFYPLFVGIMGINILVEALILPFSVFGRIKRKHAVASMKKMSEDERYHFLLIYEESIETDNSDYSVTSNIFNIIYSIVIPLFTIFALIFNVIYPLSAIVNGSVLSLVCKAETGYAILSVLCMLLYYILRVTARILTVKKDSYIHENNDREY